MQSLSLIFWQSYISCPLPDYFLAISLPDYFRDCHFHFWVQTGPGARSRSRSSLFSRLWQCCEENTGGEKIPRTDIFANDKMNQPSKKIHRERTEQNHRHHQYHHCHHHYHTKEESLVHIDVFMGACFHDWYQPLELLPVHLHMISMLTVIMIC